MTLVMTELHISLANHKNSDNALIGESRVSSSDWLDPLTGQTKPIYHRAGDGGFFPEGWICG